VNFGQLEQQHGLETQGLSIFQQIPIVLAKSHIVVIELWFKFLLQELKPMQGSILSSNLMG